VLSATSRVDLFGLDGRERTSGLPGISSSRAAICPADSPTSRARSSARLWLVSMRRRVGTALFFLLGVAAAEADQPARAVFAGRQRADVG